MSKVVLRFTSKRDKEWKNITKIVHSETEKYINSEVKNFFQKVS